MKKFLLCALSLVCAATVWAGKYSDYYTNLPTQVIEVAEVTFADRQVNISDFGGVGDGVTLNTEAFTQAIDRLSAQGGGRLIIGPGLWLTGPIELKSGVCLVVDKNAIIQFSPDKELYVDPAPKASRVKACISATRAKNIGITGEGIIDGGGAQWRPVKRSKVSDTEWKLYKSMGGVERQKGELWYPWEMKSGYPDIAETPEKQEKMRNDLFRVYHCEGILLEGVTFQNSPKFHVHPFNSVNVIIDGITVRAPWNAQNADAIDISDCHKVLIVNSTIDAGDDGFCLKSGDYKEKALVNGCEDILIRYCTAYHGHGGFVIGSEDVCGMTRIVCADTRMSGTDTGLRFKSAIGRGGKTKDVYLTRIVMNDIVGQAVIFECTYADRPAGSKEGDTVQPKELVNVPEFNDIHISDVICYGCKTAVAASGIEGLRSVYDINISNSTFRYTGTPLEIDTNTADITLNDVKLIEIKKQ